MILELPLRADIPAYTQRMDLEGVTYIFQFRYNGRMDRWFMSILNSDNEPILMGAIIVGEYPLTLRFYGGRLAIPPGLFITYDEKGLGRTPGRGDLGTDIQVIYSESGDA